MTMPEQVSGLHRPGRDATLKPLVRVTVDGRVATVLLDDPDRRNPLSTKMVEQLHAAVAGVAQNPEVRSVVITGAGPAFCAGGDVKKMQRSSGAGDANRARDLRLASAVVMGLRALRQPLIAAVNGAAAGAGLSLALLADFRIASREAVFDLAFVKRGLMPDWGITHLLPRVVGHRLALQWALRGTTLTADEALATGLVDELHSRSEVLDRAQSLAGELAKHAPLAVARTRHAMQSAALPKLESALATEAIGQLALYETSDHREGVASFLEKRPPRFTGT